MASGTGMREYVGFSVYGVLAQRPRGTIGFRVV